MTCGVKAKFDSHGRRSSSIVIWEPKLRELELFQQNSSMDDLKKELSKRINQRINVRGYCVVH